MNFTRQQLIAMIKIRPDTDCWEFQGSVDKNGFGRIFADNKEYKAHRVFYEEWVEKLIEFHYLHHRLPPEKCIGKKCCNPSHMLWDNVRTFTPPPAPLPPEGLRLCSKGHLMAPDNIVVEHRKGHPKVRCRRCRQASWRKNSARCAAEGKHT